MPNVQALLCDDHGNVMNQDNINDSAYSFDSEQDAHKKKDKKMGYYKAKLYNLTKRGVFKSSNDKGNSRYVNDIIDIKQLLENGLQSNRFEMNYKAANTEEDIADRKVLYECENIEISCYTVAKIKT